MSVPAHRCQNWALSSTPASVASEPCTARSRQPRNQCSATGSRPAGLLGGFQLVVIVFALALNLGAEAVKALMRSFCPGQSHVAHGAAQAAVAVVKRVQGDQPQVGQPGFDEGVALRGGFKPVKKAWVCAGRVAAGGASKCTFSRPTGPDTTRMGPLASVRHAATVMRAPAVAGRGTARHASQTGARRSGLVKVAGGVQHHVHHAVHMPVAGARAPHRAPACGPRRSARHPGPAARPSMALVVMTSRQHLQVAWSLRQPQLRHAPGQHAPCAVHLLSGAARAAASKSGSANRAIARGSGAWGGRWWRMR